MGCSFTKRQLQEIAAQLAMYGVKDTDFDHTGDLNNDDLIAIVQDGTNKTITAEHFVDAVSEGVAVKDYASLYLQFSVDVDTMHLFVSGLADEPDLTFSLSESGHLLFTNNNN